MPEKQTKILEDEFCSLGGGGGGFSVDLLP